MIQPGDQREATPHVHAKRERRRAEILRAAVHAFRERGYHATTLDAIAEQLGVRKTALYHYFADKPAILLACHRESILDLERIVAEARRRATPAARLRHIIVEHVRVMTEAYGGSPLALEVAALPDELQAEVIASRDRYERELREVVAAGMRTGAFRRADPKVAAFVVLGALNGIARWYRPGGALEPRALAEQFADHLLGGLLARPAPARPSPRPSARARRAGGTHRTPPRAATKDRP